MKRRNIFMICLAALMAVGMASCEKVDVNDNNNDNGGNDPTPVSLEGTTWRDASGYLTITFTDATNLILSSIGVDMDGTYTYDGTSGTITVPDVIDYTFTIDGNTMNVMDEEGSIAFQLTRVEGGSTDATPLSNSTWYLLDELTGHDYTLIFNATNGVIYGDSWSLEEESGEVVDEGELVYSGTYTYQNGAGSMTLNNMIPDSDGPATLSGTYNVDDNMLTLSLSDGTNITLTRLIFGSTDAAKAARRDAK